MKPFFPPNRQGIAIDAVVILCNLILLPVAAGRIDALFQAFFSNEQTGLQLLSLLMMMIFAGRLLGLYLKRFPLQARLADASDGSFPLFFFVFSFPLIVLTAAFVMISITATAGDAGLIEMGANGLAKPSRTVELIGTFSILFLTLLEGYLIYRLSRPLTAAEKELRENGVWIYRLPAELAADFGLFAYMMVWQVFYYQTAELLTTRADGAPMPTDMKLVSVFFVAVCFLLFYLAPRAVFLIEDRKYRGTWLMIGLVFASSLKNLL